MHVNTTSTFNVNYKIAVKSNSANCMKIHSFLTKLQTKISWLLFMAHGVCIIDRTVPFSMTLSDLPDYFTDRKRFQMQILVQLCNILTRDGTQGRTKGQYGIYTTQN